MRRLLLIAALMIFAPVLRAQDGDGERFVLWQGDASLTSQMFRGEPSDSLRSSFEALGLHSSACTAFWYALDVPRRKSGWNEPGCEKPYFCAAFNKDRSFLLGGDEQTELRYAQLLWDVCELSTRVARRNLAAYVAQHSGDIPVAGLVSIQFMTAVNDGRAFGREISDLFIQEVVIPGDADRFTQYREQIDEMLRETAQYATTPQECRRLMTGDPLSRDDKPVRDPAGDIKGRGDIIY